MTIAMTLMAIAYPGLTRYPRLLSALERMLVPLKLDLLSCGCDVRPHLQEAVRCP